MNRLYVFVLLIIMCGCKMRNTLEVDFIKNGKVLKDTIHIDKLLNDARDIKTSFINNISFEVINSAYLKNNNSEKIRFNSDSIELDFNKPIDKYSPEYYTLATSYYIDKAVRYYKRVFDNKIDFNTQKEYRNIKVLLGDYGLFTQPNQYILAENQIFSPSFFYHEVGHIAFWTLEEDLKIKFKGLSPLHVGLLEYFTVSLFDCQIVGEHVLPKTLLRSANIKCSYPQQDSMKLRRTMHLFEYAYHEQIKDTSTIVSKSYNRSMELYSNYLDVIVDNHRGGMLYTSTLWRIREQLGQEKTDRLVAKTILGLNDFMKQRSSFYQPCKLEKLKGKVMWYDLYYGLLKTDKELFKGMNWKVIEKEFIKSNFPIEKIKIANIL